MEDIEAAVAHWADGHWNSLALPVSQPCNTLAVDPTAPGTIHAGGSLNLQRTLDAGRRWIEISPFSGLEVYRIAMGDGNHEDMRKIRENLIQAAFGFSRLVIKNGEVGFDFRK